MQLEKLNELRNKDFISETQHAHLESIFSKKIFSVYYELRILLYLGILLFTTGLGILIYKNIGDIGHLLSIIALFILTALCFAFAYKNSSDYTNARATATTPYFDYVVLFGCLLFISALGYLQFQYAILDDGMGATTLVTAAFFFYVAYRFDNIGVLSLAITALASFWSISISPQKWYSGSFFETANLELTAMAFGVVLGGIAFTLDRKNTKQHFTFTYLNFCSLVFLTGALAGMFMNDRTYGYYLLALYLGCTAIAYYANRKKSFLFLLYAFVFGYIGTTYLLSDIILDDAGLWFFYLLVSCGSFIAFIVRYKSFFKRAA